MNVLVTGDRGFVGRHMLRALCDRYPTCTITGVDLVDGIDVRDFFRTDQTRYDLVIHLAAVVGGRVQIERDPLSLAVDLAIDADLFGWALRTRPGKIVYFSSSAAYPIDLQTREAARPLAEDLIDLAAIASPDLTYGWAKLTGEMLATHARQAGLDVLVVRPFSGYGPDQDLTYPFPAIIERAARRDDPFAVWGDGEQTRDFIHIDDVCHATLTAVDLNVPGPVNIGTGRATSFNDLAGLITAAAGYQPTIRHLPAQPVGVHHRVADPARLLSFYTPQITLERGIADALSRAPAVP